MEEKDTEKRKPSKSDRKTPGAELKEIERIIRIIIIVFYNSTHHRIYSNLKKLNGQTQLAPRSPQ